MAMIRFEDEPSDNYYDLVQKALFVELPSRVIDAETVPLDGHEFIYKSRLEDLGLKYHVEETLNSTSTPLPSKRKSITDWGRQQAKRFSDYALRLKREKPVLKKTFVKKFETPATEVDWCTFCLGDELTSEIYNHVTPTRAEPGHLPLLSIVLNLSQEEVKELLKYLHQWYQGIGIKDVFGKWIYALLACLEKPLDEEFQDFLEMFYEDCKKDQKFCEDPEKKDILCLISSVLVHCFCVKAYKVLPSLERHLN